MVIIVVKLFFPLENIEKRTKSHCCRWGMMAGKSVLIEKLSSKKNVSEEGGTY